MASRARIGIILTAITAVVVGISVYLSHAKLPVLLPAGPVAYGERRLMIIVLCLSLIIAIPVFIMLGVFAWKYRESNTKAHYTPNWDGSKVAETIWWLIPSALIAILAVVSWHATHELDPSVALASSEPPMTIQVVALDWKWLFIYPSEHIATVNFLEIPQGRPIKFEITSDAPMNSFWIPQLGGQIYAMAGMSTTLNLLADHTGDFQGASANLSGKGFAGMKFTTRSATFSDYSSWVNEVKASPTSLTGTEYAHLSKPSENSPISYYASPADGLYDQIVMKYMSPDINMTDVGMSHL